MNDAAIKDVGLGVKLAWFKLALEGTRPTKIEST
jgi:hypothetical protein